MKTNLILLICCLGFNAFCDQVANRDGNSNLTVGERVQAAETRLMELSNRFKPANTSATLDERVSAIEGYFPSIGYTNSSGMPLTIPDRVGQIEAAISTLSASQKLPPTATASDYYNIGLQKRQQGDLEAALIDLNKAIELMPDFTNAYYFRGTIKDEGGDLNGALADYNITIEFDPSHAWAHFHRGGIKQVKGDLEGAFADYNTAIELKPNFSKAYLNRGLAKEQKGDADGALVDYNKAIELNSKFANAYNQRGNHKAAQYDFVGALADFSKAISLEPDVGYYYHCRGWMYYSEGCMTSDYPVISGPHFKDAVNDFRKAIELKHADEIYSCLGLWLINSRSSAGGRTGSKLQSSNNELQEHLSHYSSEGSQDSHAGRAPRALAVMAGKYLIGEISEDDLLKAASTLPYNECQAYFYAGTKRLIDGDKTTAIAYFKKCLATDQIGLPEYMGASAELKNLERLNINDQTDMVNAFRAGETNAQHIVDEARLNTTNTYQEIWQESKVQQLESVMKNLEKMNFGNSAQDRGGTSTNK